MIDKSQSVHLWSDDDHLTDLARPFLGRGLGAKWTALQGPIPRRTYQASEWDRSFIGIRVEAYSRSPASDDELFQQAAAKVNHKIQMDRKILGGAPCIAGTRIPVYAILQLVEAGYSHKRILKSFPSLSRENLETALRFSAIVMER